MPRHDEVRVWSVFDTSDRLVLALSDQPGEFNFARLPPPDVPPLQLGYATAQCYASKVESELLKLVQASTSVEGLLDRLTVRGFRVIAGRPRSGRLARL